MRTLVNYFRQVFCKHAWNFEECTTREFLEGRLIRTGQRVTATCQKCAYYKSYWKFE